ncbi:PREDICTED: pentatricopeptide repeat-containing protein At1g05600 [Tarenaya hassleriana]|uniref:pentatricopeptide repeat-containing protein At1g05600 n=1 Tax=Tarenaya hassleriana TaxID=28532 RepID=UPI00053C488D|nr:PREDICTED: pentatricopeptide repeat-containing protein At1g05600 [Tarenaya hassleriana]
MSVRWPRVLTPNLLSQIIKKQKNPLTALRIFEEAKERFPGYSHNGSVYATMIGILGKSGRLSEMKHVIERMKGDSCECKDTVFASAIRTFSRAGRLGDAISLFKSLPEFNCVEWTLSLNTLLQEMVKDSRLEMACRIFQKHSYGWEVKSRETSLNFLMRVLCQINRSDLAAHVFQEMNYQGCYPDRESYKILMEGFCLEGKLNEATHLLYSMFWRISQKGAGEDIVVYRILLDALCDAGKIDEAIEILGKILRKGLKSPKRCYNHIDFGQWDGKTGSVEHIKRLITETLIRGTIPSLASYDAMAADLYSAGRLAEGDEVLKAMRGKSFKPTPSIYEAKVTALCRAGRLEDAMAVIAGEMRESHCLPTVGVYNILIKGLCDEGKSMLAVGYLEKMSKQVGSVPNEETYATLVSGLCRDGEFLEASRVMEEMLIKSFLPGVETYNVLIKGLCGMCRGYEAVVWLEEMVSQGMMPESSVWNAFLSESVCYNAIDTGEILEHLTEQV